MSEAQTAYNLPRAKWLSEDDVRRKGTQQGYVRKRGKAWHIEFHEWRTDADGTLRYLPTSRAVGPCIGPKRLTKTEAQAEGVRRFVAKANGVNALPQCIATVEQFIEARFRPDHINHLKKSGRQHPPLHTFCAIAETLKVEVTELLPERRAASTEQIDVKALAGNQVRGADELAFITTGIGGKGTEHGDNTTKKNSGNGRRASR